MSEHETIEKVKSKRGLLSKIQDFFLLGYSTREDLRELDKQLRVSYYDDLQAIRHKWEDLYLDIIDAKVDFPNRDLKRVIQVLDRVIEKIHHADYGYAGLFDRKGNINEVELARVFNYDQSLSSDLEAMLAAVNQAYGNVEAENWTEAKVDVENVKKILYNLEEKWNKREGLFRPLTI